LAGYWRGTATPADTQRTRAAEALVDSDGDLQLMVLHPTDLPDANPSFVLHGNICCEDHYEDRLVGTRYLDSRDSASQMRASLENGALVGRFEFRQQRWNFSLARSPAYDAPLSMALVAGVYSQTETSVFGVSSTLTLAVDAQGLVTGSHTNGCAYNGHIDIPDPTHNLMRFAIEVNGCGDSFTSSRRWNGKYEGLGLLKSDGHATALYHSLVGSTWSGPQLPAK
jgi:hypothetical protein